MKLSKKMIIPAFTLLVGASLAGSISGTVAWYQYSTRTNVSYVGTSAGTIGNLQVRIAGGNWGTQLSIQDVQNYLSSTAEGVGSKVEPITPGALAKNGSLTGKDFYLNPQVGVGPYDHWRKASVANYVKLPLQLRFIGEDEDDLKAKDVYLSKLVIQQDTVRDPDHANHGDISDAIRVHFSAYKEGEQASAINHLVSKNGGTTLTHGKLRLGRGADFDKGYADADDEFGFNDSEYGYVNYGGTSGSQVSYAAASAQTSGAYYEEEGNGWKQLAIATSGDVAPDDAVGQEGDFYYDTAAEKLYQKGQTAWAEFANEFLAGTADPNLNTANPNGKDYYFNSNNNKLFQRLLPTNETIDPVLVENDADNPLKIKEASITADKKIGATIATADPQKYLNVDVTIWVEGWHKFQRNGMFTSIWDGDLIGAWFDVGMQFAVQAE